MAYDKGRLSQQSEKPALRDADVARLFEAPHTPRNAEGKVLYSKLLDSLRVVDTCAPEGPRRASKADAARALLPLLEAAEEEAFAGKGDKSSSSGGSDYGGNGPGSREKSISERDGGFHVV